MSRPGARWLGSLAVLLVLAGCTGIPSSSAPQVVRTVGRSIGPDATRAHIAPQPGDAPRDVVKGFIAAGADAGSGLSTARQFLTTRAAPGWKPNQTVILDNTNPGEGTISSSGDTASVPVTGHRTGQIDANGIFSPMLKGMGSGDEETFDFTLTKVNGQWRIDQPPPGVLIDASAFGSSYRQRTLYFMDSTQSILVPDLRYSSLTGSALASWLLAELIAGPRPELAQTVLNEVPNQVGKPSVQIGNPTVVDLPGTAQLDIPSHNTLAAQLAFTLSQVDDVQLNGGQLELTDAGKPVRIPGAGGLRFSTRDFCSASRVQISGCSNSGPGAALYFLRFGAVDGYDNTHKQVVPAANLLGQPNRNFVSVALRQGSAGALQAAGLVGSSMMQIGSDTALTPTRLPASATSRPEWQPYSDDVWVAVGSRIVRVTAGGPVIPVSLTSQVSALPTGPITAVRLSSDGDRVALVIRGPAGIGTVWVGSVVSSGSDVRIDSLEPVTPPALSVTDVAWADQTRLELVAAELGAEARVWTVYSDGSQLAKVSNQDLPGPPIAITAAQNQSTVVSVGTGSTSSIWKATVGSSPSNTSWFSLSGTDALISGTNPVYAA